MNHIELTIDHVWQETGNILKVNHKSMVCHNQLYAKRVPSHRLRRHPVMILDWVPACAGMTFV